MRFVLTGGGTGGHIYPAIAMINEIKQHDPNAEFLYIGSEKGLEKKIVEKEGIPFVAIDITGFKRKISYDNVRTMIRFFKSVAKSKQYLNKFQPNIVIGTGGFVCGPVLYAASKLNIPTVIHEQNVIPGLTNKFLAGYVDLIAISFEGSKKYFNRKNVVLTGNPRATEVAKANKETGYKILNLEDNKKNVLIFGGSRGAKAINSAFIDMFPNLSEYPECQFIFVTGEVHYSEIKKEVEKFESKYFKNVLIYPYIYNMPEVLAVTDLSVSRAGASTLAEITALGIPSILIPSPYVTNNHQELNAKWLEAQGAAIMITEKELNGDRLLSMILAMMKERNKFVTASAKVGIPDAATRIYHEIIGIINNKA